LGPGARLVVDPLPEAGRARLGDAGLEMIAEEEGVVVSRRPA
jgi:hypothetical protein